MIIDVYEFQNMQITIYHSLNKTVHSGTFFSLSKKWRSNNSLDDIVDQLHERMGDEK